MLLGSGDACHELWGGARRVCFAGRRGWSAGCREGMGWKVEPRAEGVVGQVRYRLAGQMQVMLLGCCDLVEVVGHCTWGGGGGGRYSWNLGGSRSPL